MRQDSAAAASYGLLVDDHHAALTEEHEAGSAPPPPTTPCHSRCLARGLANWLCAVQLLSAFLFAHTLIILS